MNNISEFLFNPFEHPLNIVVARLLEIEDTSVFNYLHLMQDVPTEVVRRETDQNTHWHRLFYHGLTKSIEHHRDLFNAHYHHFLRSVLPDFFPFETQFAIQKVPNLRIQVPSNLGVGAFHRDSDYGHNPEELNIFLPLTSALRTNTIWTETEEGVGDYIPLNVEVYGKGYIWKGVKLHHGNKVSKETWTRVSLDFRVVPMSKFVCQEGTFSVNVGTRFDLGHYYEVLEK